MRSSSELVRGDVESTAPPRPGRVERRKRGEDQNQPGTKLETPGVSLTSTRPQIQTAWGPAGPLPSQLSQALRLESGGI